MDSRVVDMPEMTFVQELRIGKANATAILRWGPIYRVPQAGESVSIFYWTGIVREVRHLLTGPRQVVTVIFHPAVVSVADVTDIYRASSFRIEEP